MRSGNQDDYTLWLMLTRKGFPILRWKINLILGKTVWLREGEDRIDLPRMNREEDAQNIADMLHLLIHVWKWEPHLFRLWWRSHRNPRQIIGEFTRNNIEVVFWAPPALLAEEVRPSRRAA